MTRPHWFLWGLLGACSEHARDMLGAWSGHAGNVRAFEFSNGDCSIFEFLILGFMIFELSMLGFSDSDVFEFDAFSCLDFLLIVILGFQIY